MTKLTPTQITLGFATALLLNGCVNTHVSLDLREPQHTEARVLADLDPSAIDMLTLQNPELINGTLDERAKQIGMCDAFFQAHPRIESVINNSGPVKVDGVTVTKQVLYQNGQLSCGFDAQGKASQVLQALQGSSIISATDDQGKIHITIDTSDTSYLNLPDTSLFGALGEAFNQKNPPKLYITIRGNELSSNYEPGEKSSSTFQLEENLLGKRIHYQTRFTVSVSDHPATMTQKIHMWLGDLWRWLKHTFEQVKSAY